MKKGILVLLLLLFVIPSWGQTPATDTKEFGIVADGKTDDTAAIQKALDAAGKAGGKEVFLPAAKYRIEGSLLIPPGVTLSGSWQAPHHEDQVWGTTLLAIGNRGKEEGPALIELSPDSTVKGLTIYYPEQRVDDIQPYPWAIQGRGMHNSVIDITLVNAYQGINFGSYANELHYIRNVFGCCLRRGIFIDKCTDIGRIENVHFNPHYWARANVTGDEKVKDFGQVIDYLNKNAEIFIFGRSDWEYVLNTFAFAFDKCYKFVKIKDGACNGNFLGIGADGGHHALWVEETQPPGLQITNGEFVTFAGDDAAQIVATDTFTGVIQLNNCSFWGPTDRCATIAGKGYTSFQQCNFVHWNQKGKNSPALQIEGGRVSVVNCFFQQDKPQIFLGAKTSSAIITGNQFTGKARIANESKAQIQQGFNVELEK